MTFMVDCEAAAGTVFSFGACNVGIESGVTLPTDAVDAGVYEKQAISKAVVVDTVHNFIQGGSTKAFSSAAYTGYTAGTWTDLTANAAGKRMPIPAGTSKFRVEVTASFTGNGMGFPTEPSATWNFDATKAYNANMPPLGHTKSG